MLDNGRMLRTSEANLVAGMRWLQNVYTRRFSLGHQFWGHLSANNGVAVDLQTLRDSTDWSAEIPRPSVRSH